MRARPSRLLLAATVAFAAAAPDAGAQAPTRPPADSAVPAEPRFDIDRRLPRAARPNPDAVAIVIGNRTYASPDLPSVDYAGRDAQSIRRYLVESLGYASENIIVLENAGKAALERTFGSPTSARGRLFGLIKPGQSDVFVYYSGHGAPDPETGRSYIVPSDADPRYLEIEGYPLQLLYDNLAKLPARSLTVVIDACFSGSSARGPIVKGASGGILRLDHPLLAAPNAVLFTASAQDEVSSWHDEQQHGLFTYYFLKGLQGPADADGDNRLTALELDAYVGKQVSYLARRLWNRQQSPQLVTAADPARAVVAEYGGDFVDVEPPPAVGVLAEGGGDIAAPVTRADRLLAERAIRAAVDSLVEYVKAGGRMGAEPVYRLRPGVDPRRRERFLSFVKKYRPTVTSADLGDATISERGATAEVALGLRWRGDFGTAVTRTATLRAAAVRAAAGVWRVETVQLSSAFP